MNKEAIKKEALQKAIEMLKLHPELRGSQLWQQSWLWDYDLTLRELDDELER